MTIKDNGEKEIEEIKDAFKPDRCKKGIGMM